MLLLPRAVRIHLAAEPVDMRKSIDGLFVHVQRVLVADAYSGHLFVFVSKRRDKVKVLAWDGGGFLLLYKRLEAGRFRMPDVAHDATSVQLDSTQLAMLLDGIDVSRVRRPVQWQPPEQPAESQGTTARR
ncbi:IS66 family insertion sequence element accessory protein TnpB [Myxococcus landrumensis]|uniref:IS66 family insertion sequence element accessory protein TnpB n=1 Tax=Myxococcus landrumensis TaxID=2813577 RepID=A0ABX7NGE3_9BACT|nr:IS66 family insertion sequence element accessory protein TnpB [Myxococcus landrumus]QSQ17480.1 IS66 family insertion sequence element accessory protein TnpB [Myxococcus landrumus]QSQ17906.1 IS66 family insertion sequence element accessory protein TnpB [Myxococcus landrumus]